MAKNETKRVKVRIPLRQGENKIRFPNCCVYCGEPAARAHTMKERVSQQVGQTGWGPFARRSFVASTARLEVPYCRNHFVAAWLEKWVLAFVGLVAWIISMRAIYYLASDTFLVEGDIWPKLLFTLAIGVSLALAGGAMWVAQRAIGLVFPTIYDVDVNPFKEGSTKSLLGIDVDAISLSSLELTLHNSQVAEAVRQLNAGRSGAAVGIDVWQEPDEAGVSSRLRLIVGWVAIVVGGLLSVGTLIVWLVSSLSQSALNPGIPEDAAIGLVCMSALICVVPAVAVGGILVAAGVSQVRHGPGGRR
jgi:hypothetical protein